MLHINPITHVLEGGGDRQLSALEFTRLNHPPCPACGRAVLLKTKYAGRLDELDRWVIIGWTCPSGCSSWTDEQRG